MVSLHLSVWRGRLELLAQRDVIEGVLDPAQLRELLCEAAVRLRGNQVFGVGGKVVKVDWDA